MSNEKTIRSTLEKIRDLLLENPIGLALAAKTASIEFQSRINGKRIRKSIQYFKEDNNIQAFCEKRKSWWENLKNGAPVNIVIKGERYQGWAEVIEEKKLISRNWAEFTKSISKRISSLSSTDYQESGDFGIEESKLANLVLINVQLS